MQTFKELEPGETFRFSCHPEVPCFNACCRDLNQFLTPYDILRLTKRLELPSTVFLEKYTAWHTGPQSGLPVVTLKALEQGLPCPFVSPAGCKVYENRPGACRTYPLGRMAARTHGSDDCRESFFLIQEPHCRGFGESKEWTAESWNKDQDLALYNEMNDLMMDVISSKRQSGKKALTREEKERFYVACYDLDRFRDLFLEKELWKSGTREGHHDPTAAENDEQLIRFALGWVTKKLFGV